MHNANTTIKKKANIFAKEVHRPEWTIIGHLNIHKKASLTEAPNRMVFARYAHATKRKESIKNGL